MARNHDSRRPIGTTEPAVRDTWLILSYLGLAIAFFFPALNPAVQIFGTDYLAGAYFSHQFVGERLASGELPKWNPYLYGGMPYFANPGSTFYPPMMALRAVLPVHAVLPWLFVLHFFAAGVGTFYLVREIGGRRLAAWLGGLSFMFTAFLASNVYAGHDGRLIVATLTPLFLFAIHRGARLGGLRWFVLGGAVLGFSLLSFQIQNNYYMLLAGAIVAVYALVRFRDRYEGRGLALRLGGGALILALGFGMATVNFLPFLSYVEHSPRGMEGGRGYDYSISYSMPPLELVGLALPDYAGMNVGEGRAYWGQNPFKLHTEYLGAWALVMLAVAMVVLRRDRRAWLWTGMAGLFVLVSLGGYTPFYRILYEVLPGTRQFRAPSISFFLVVLSLNVLAALAFSRVQDAADRLRTPGDRARKVDADPERKHLLYALGGAAGVALLAALWVVAGQPAGPGDVPGGIAGDPRRANAFLTNYENAVAGAGRLLLFTVAVAGLLWAYLTARLRVLPVVGILALLMVADLWIVDRRFLDTVEHPDRYFAANDVVRALQAAQEPPFRVWFLPGTDQTSYPSIHGIELVAGEHGNQLQRYNEYLGAGADTYTDYSNVGRFPAFLHAANIRYLVSSQPLESPVFTQVHQGSAFVYRNEQAQPRAYLVSGYRVADEPDGALEAMRAPDFDPASEVVLYEEPPVQIGGDGAAGEADVLRHDPDEVEIRVRAGAPALLVLADNYYAGWNAEVDGAETPILRANHTFRAVAVPAGESTVRFTFRPVSMQIGYWTYLGLLGLLLAYGGWLLWASRRRRETDAGGG